MSSTPRVAERFAVARAVACAAACAAAFVLTACGGSDNGTGPEPCTADPNPVFTHAITDLAQLAHIAPLGEVQTDRSYSTHTYLHIGNAASVPVRAPHAMEIYNVVSSGVDYAFEARINCNVYLSYGHITAPIASLVAAARTSHIGLSPNAPMVARFAAGDLLGTTTGTAQARSWDFGVYNKARTLPLLNPARAPLNDKVVHSTCPYDYYAGALRTDHYDRFGPLPRALPSSCRSGERGVVGTIAGTWFENAGDRDGAYSNPTISPVMVASTLVGSVRWFVGTTGIHGTEGVPLPENVTTQQCYPNAPAGYTFFKVAGPATLHLARSATGSCPSSFPATGFTVYTR